MTKFRVTEDKIIPYDQRPQQFMGVAVIARQQAQLPHPHPGQGGRLVPTRGVTQVLLDNGHTFGECDVCGVTKESLKSVVAHLTSHNANKNTPVYDPEVLRRVMRVAAEERAVSHRGYGDRAAARLNQSDVKTTTGRPWTAAGVGGLWLRYHEQYGPTRVRRTRTVAPTSPAAPTMKGASKKHPLNVFQDLGTKLDELDVGVAETTRRLSELRDLAAALAAHVTDPAIVEKARKYDELVAAIKGSQ